MSSGRGGAVVVAVLVALGGYGYTQAAAESSTGGSGERCVVAPQSVRGFERAQVKHAATIAEVGVEMGIPKRGVVVALATAMQESNLHNLDYGPPGEDSLGLFQQRPSQGWGSVEQVMDPEHAARSFYRALRRVDGWRDMRITEAAQAVQRSAYPEAYQQWADEGRRLASLLLRRC